MKKLLTLILGIALLATIGGLVTMKAATTVNSSKSNNYRTKPTPTPTPKPGKPKPKPTPTPTPKPKK